VNMGCSFREPCCVDYILRGLTYYVGCVRTLLGFMFPCPGEDGKRVEAKRPAPTDMGA
jgi:hypothetical protein